MMVGDSECFRIREDGLLLFSNETACCGDHVLRYRYKGCEGDLCVAEVRITVKCPKPECFVVDLEDFVSTGPIDGGNPDGEQSCVYTCENSTATYFVSYTPTSTYSWSVTGGTIAFGTNPAEILVTWGSMGVGSIALTIVNSNNETIVIEVCVTILEGPTAAFQALTNTVCLNSPINFINNSIGGDDFLWDFGDGNFSNSFEPSHQYSSPGSYDVTLYVTKNNYDDEGNPPLLLHRLCITRNRSRSIAGTSYLLGVHPVRK